VSYIDGCGVEFRGNQASAGFGGFNFPRSNYSPYAAWAGKRAHNGRWNRGKYMRARMGRHYLTANLAEGTIVRCSKGSISIRVPRKLRGKIGGMAGTGIAGDWRAGPNRQASGLRPNQRIPGLGRTCHHRYQYGNPRSPFNGNRASKPIVKLLKSWQVGKRKELKSAFRYSGGKSQGSFNRVAGQAIKPIRGVTKKRPNGAKKKAKHVCRPLRNNKKYFEKCLFDFMVLGEKAVRRNLRDRMQKRRGKPKKPNSLSVRDLSRWRNDAKWVGKPSWGCVDGFANMIHDLHKKHASAAHKKKFMSENCKCRAKYLGQCAYDHFICIAHIKLTEYRNLLVSHVYGK
jgi:hypothetical protein